MNVMVYYSGATFFCLPFVLLFCAFFFAASYLRQRGESCDQWEQWYRVAAEGTVGPTRVQRNGTDTKGWKEGKETYLRHGPCAIKQVTWGLTISQSHLTHRFSVRHSICSCQPTPAQHTPRPTQRKNIPAHACVRCWSIGAPLGVLVFGHFRSVSVIFRYVAEFSTRPPAGWADHVTQRHRALGPQCKGDSGSRTGT